MLQKAGSAERLWAFRPGFSNGQINSGIDGGRKPDRFS